MRHSTPMLVKYCEIGQALRFGFTTPIVLAKNLLILVRQPDVRTNPFP
jgi:hypothetical protein